MVSDFQHPGIPAGAFPLNQAIHVDPGGDDCFQIIYSTAYRTRQGGRHRLTIQNITPKTTTIKPQETMVSITHPPKDIRAKRKYISPHSASPAATDFRMNISPSR
jgi:hypothetical protein